MIKRLQRKTKLAKIVDEAIRYAFKEWATKK